MGIGYSVLSKAPPIRHKAGRMTEIINGVDYAWSHPGGAALRAAGMHFAGRYLSSDVKKNLSRTEADDLAANGLWSVVVWETTANRAGAGMAAGQADARTAMVQAKACGIPDGRPIYFAVDYDAPPSAVAPYFQGVASVLTPARTGVYGGYRVVKALLDSKAVQWAWQTVAWSGGQWDSRAVIRQHAETVKINGVSCDKDFAYAADYGQWMPGKIPTPTEENMALSPADATEIAKAVWGHKTDDPRTAGTQYTDAGTVLWWAGADAHAARTTIAAQAVTIEALAGKLGAGVDTAAVIAAVQAAVAKLIIETKVTSGGAA